MEGDTDASTRDTVVHHSINGTFSIRRGDWKLINTQGSRGFGADRKQKYDIALYNLKNDLLENNNLANEMPEKVESLKKKIRQILGN